TGQIDAKRDSMPHHPPRSPSRWPFRHGLRRGSRCTFLALGLALAGTKPAATNTPKTVFLEKLTWTELRDLMAARKTTIIIPIGGTKQNGPHMALGKHNVRAKALAAKIATQLGNALVAPEIAYVPEGSINPPTGHMRFPGTISVPDDVLTKLLEYAARSFRQ